MTNAKKQNDENLKNENELGDEKGEKDTTNETVFDTDSTEQASEAKSTESTKAQEECAEDEANAEIKNLSDKLLRLQADFLNYKNRTEKEKGITYSNAISDLILELLPVIDNLERALAAENSKESSLKEGVQMIYNQMMGIFEKRGMKEIEALHKPFDHNVHYGVGFETSNEYEDGIVIDVMQKGYTVNDRCIRPAMVRIAKND